MTEKTHRRIRFTSRDKWKLAVTVGKCRDGRFGIVSIGKQRTEYRPLDFAPFHVMDAVLGSQPERFDTLDEAEAYARTL